MGKQPDRLVSLAGGFQNSAVILATATAKHGGNLSEALIRLGTPSHEKEVDQIAHLLARISRPLEYLQSHRGNATYVHIVRGVVVNESLEWGAAIREICPNIQQTELQDDILKAAPHFPAQRNARVKNLTVVLAKFSRFHSHDAKKIAREWGEQEGLPYASPRTVLALGKHASHLRQVHAHMGRGEHDYFAFVAPAYDERYLILDSDKDGVGRPHLGGLTFRYDADDSWHAFACESFEES